MAESAKWTRDEVGDYQDGRGNLITRDGGRIGPVFTARLADGRRLGPYARLKEAKEAVARNDSEEN